MKANHKKYYSQLDSGLNHQKRSKAVGKILKQNRIEKETKYSYGEFKLELSVPRTKGLHEILKNAIKQSASTNSINFDIIGKVNLKLDMEEERNNDIQNTISKKPEKLIIKSKNKHFSNTPYNNLRLSDNRVYSELSQYSKNPRNVIIRKLLKNQIVNPNNTLSSTYKNQYNNPYCFQTQNVCLLFM